MNNESLLKTVEQNALNEAKFWTDFMEFTQAMRFNIEKRDDSNGNPNFERGGMKKLKEGLALMQAGAYEEMHYAISRCFVFAGVGGEAARAYSRERAQKMLQGVPVNWLDEHFRLPNSWDAESMKRLEDEAHAVRVSTVDKP